MNDFRKNAIVTGATGAIGTAIARQLAVKGFDVTIIAKSCKKKVKRRYVPCNV
jgi:short-subunit dehydrogenase